MEKDDETAAGVGLPMRLSNALSRQNALKLGCKMVIKPPPSRHSFGYFRYLESDSP